MRPPYARWFQSLLRCECASGSQARRAAHAVRHSVGAWLLLEMLGALHHTFRRARRARRVAQRKQVARLPVLVEAAVREPRVERRRQLAQQQHRRDTVGGGAGGGDERGARSTVAHVVVVDHDEKAHLALVREARRGDRRRQLRVRAEERDDARVVEHVRHRCRVVRRVNRHCHQAAQLAAQVDAVELSPVLAQQAHKGAWREQRRELAPLRRRDARRHLARSQRLADRRQVERVAVVAVIFIIIIVVVVVVVAAGVVVVVGRRTAQRNHKQTRPLKQLAVSEPLVAHAPAAAVVHRTTDGGPRAEKVHAVEKRVHRAAARQAPRHVGRQPDALGERAVHVTVLLQARRADVDALRTLVLEAVVPQLAKLDAPLAVEAVGRAEKIHERQRRLVARIGDKRRRRRRHGGLVVLDGVAEALQRIDHAVGHDVAENAGVAHVKRRRDLALRRIGAKVAAAADVGHRHTEIDRFVVGRVRRRCVERALVDRRSVGGGSVGRRGVGKHQIALALLCADEAAHDHLPHQVVDAVARRRRTRTIGDVLGPELGQQLVNVLLRDDGRRQRQVVVDDVGQVACRRQAAGRTQRLEIDRRRRPLGRLGVAELHEIRLAARKHNRRLRSSHFAQHCRKAPSHDHRVRARQSEADNADVGLRQHETRVVGALLAASSRVPDPEVNLLASNSDVKRKRVALRRLVVFFEALLRVPCQQRSLAHSPGTKNRHFHLSWNRKSEVRIGRHRFGLCDCSRNFSEWHWHWHRQ